MGKTDIYITVNYYDNTSKSVKRRVTTSVFRNRDTVEKYLAKNFNNRKAKSFHLKGDIPEWAEKIYL